MKVLLGSLLALSLMCAQANASLINLTKTVPDVTSFFIDVNYVYTSGTNTGLLTANGFAWTLDFDGVIQPGDSITNSDYGSFNITATLNGAGNIINGSLFIGGKNVAAGATSGTLLTGNLTQIGFQNPPGGTFFDFKFNTTGGDLAKYGSQFGVNLETGNANFTGAWNASFSNDLLFGDSTKSDAFPTQVPEPATMTLLLVGMGIAGFKRFRKTV